MLRQFFAYYRPHRRLFILDFSCAVIAGLLELVFPLAIKSFVDTLLPSHKRAIQSSLAELAVGRTTLVIAHRLATIQHADRIVVVDETGVAEEGAHHELIAAGGLYRRLHEAQFQTLDPYAPALES